MAIYQDNRGYVDRLGWLRILFAVMVLLLMGRLWYLSIIRFEYYSQLAEQNHVRTIPLVAPRGLILDREKRVLAENRYGFDLAFFREENPDVAATLRFLDEGLGWDPEALRERLRAAAGQSLYRPVILKENLDLDEIAYLLAHRNERPELDIFKRPRRDYRYGDVAAHSIGYVGEISREELLLDAYRDKRPGDLVGKYGIEKSYNRHLTGVDGHQRVVVDSRGKTLEGLDLASPREGRPLTLTIDLDLQLAAEEALGEKSGAVVAFNPNSGEVLVLASKPSFDPNRFAGRLSLEEWNQLLENPDDPLQNKALQSTFPPGSIYKIIVALAGLEKGVVDEKTSVFCNGSITLYGHPFRCWNAGGHGHVTLVEALQHSCNIYFYLLGQKLGIDELAEFSTRLGLGQPTHVDLVGEAAGLVPTAAWKKKATGHPWYAGETISVAIGQGPVNVTPLQLARAIGIVATGKMPQLHMSLTESAESPARTEALIGLDPRHLKLVREAMWRVVNEQGTGYGARVEAFEVCGKTGTVQTVSQSTRSKLSQKKAEGFTPHAWFVGFAPRDDPQLVVAVLVQRGGSGASGAAPIAGRIFRLFRDKQLEPESTDPALTRAGPDSRATRAGGGR